MEFKARITRAIFYFLALNGFIVLISFLSKSRLQPNAIFILLLLVNISYLASIITKPFKITIDRDKSLLKIHYLSTILRKGKTFPLLSTTCTFKYEIRARGVKVKVLRVIYDGKTVVELLPDYNGWEEKSLDQIYKELNVLND